MEEPRDELVEVCHLMASQSFTSATGGNVSVKMPDGTIWLTPSRLHKRKVQIEDLVLINDEKQILDGERAPTSEVPMHLAVYRALPQAGAVIHAHPPVATGFALACKPLDASASSEAYFILGPGVPLLPYARPSTEELATMVGAAMDPMYKAYLLANHGVLTWGADLSEAYDILDTLEMFAQSQFAAMQLGGAGPLPAEELDWLRQKKLSFYR